MSKFIIHGGQPLRGAVRLGGAKNASFKLMIAAALGSQETRLLNLSHIGDVGVTRKTLEALGVKVWDCGERTLYIKPQKPITTEIPQFAGEKSRASTLFAAYLLSEVGEARIPMPGGCSLGPRPVDRHLDGLKALGTEVIAEAGWYRLKANRLIGNTYRFPKKSHTGTEALIIAAVKAQGQTIIENAAQEPEVDDLIKLLNKMGGNIYRESGEKIIIEGVQTLAGAIHQVMPDRNEAVSYAVAALATQGDIVVENAQASQIGTFLEKVAEIGGNYEVADYGVRFWYDQPLQAMSIETTPHPGFMTDWQPMWTILMTQARGVSTVLERVSYDRLQYTQALREMGADIALFNPEVVNPEAFYEFDDPSSSINMHAARITGPTKLKAIDHEVLDLRAGATLTIAALVASGTSTLTGIDKIDRGYEKLAERLAQLGAKIERKD